MTVEEFLQLYPGRMRRVAEWLRELVKTVTAGAVVERVYPGWKLIGYRKVQESGTKYFCFIAPFDDHVKLGFEYGAHMNDPEGILEGGGTQVRHVVIRKAGEIDPQRLAPYIEEAARLASLPKPFLREQQKDSG